MSILSVLENKRSWWVETADVLVGLAQIPDNSIDCVVTSPPYWNLRDYGTATWLDGDPACDHKAGRFVYGGLSEKQASNAGSAGHGAFKDTCGKCGATRIDQQIGLEKTLEEFIDKLVVVFREVRRVLKPTGVVWLDMGDSYAQSGMGGNPEESGFRLQASNTGSLIPGHRAPAGFKPKDIMLIPHRLAIALCDDGWYIRSDLVWAKGVSLAETYHGSVMPESVNDRPSRSHEYVFLLTKSGKYYYDKYAVQEKIQTESYERATRGVSDHHKNLTVPGQSTHSMHKARANGEGYKITDSGGRNLRSVWCINPSPFSGAHYATFPPRLVNVCVSLGSSERGCCSKCSKPWKRIVEPTKEYAKHLGKDWANYDLDEEEGRGHFEIDGEKSSQRPTKRNGASLTADYISKGWGPTCKCEDAGEPLPSLILDPFSGAATVAMVARRLGRRAIGIELNEEYAEMGRQRVIEDSPMFNS